jgi:hypothetical protein
MNRLFSGLLLIILFKIGLSQATIPYGFAMHGWSANMDHHHLGDPIETVHSISMYYIPPITGLPSRREGGGTR